MKKWMILGLLLASAQSFADSNLKLVKVCDVPEGVSRICAYSSGGEQDSDIITIETYDSRGLRKEVHSKDSIYFNSILAGISSMACVSTHNIELCTKPRFPRPRGKRAPLHVSQLSEQPEIQ